jgi:hypothetical protein
MLTSALEGAEIVVGPVGAALAAGGCAEAAVDPVAGGVVELAAVGDFSDDAEGVACVSGNEGAPAVAGRWAESSANEAGTISDLATACV